jgi:aldehyde dehydrogenase (NAD+)
MRDLKHKIGAEWIAAGAPAVLENPSDLDNPVARFSMAPAALAEEAVAAARACAPGWAAASPQVRSDVLDRAGSALLARKEELGRLLSSEEGKVMAEGVAEVVRAAQILKYCAGEALRLSGELLASTRPGVDVEILREPVGVAALITPWNFPIAIPAWKLGPALAYGNCAVLKPSEIAPASAAALLECLEQAGLPAGAANLVIGGPEVGEALVAAGGVDAVSFTGSAAVGRRVAVRCAELGKRTQCEMGGKNPLVVLDDADLDAAAAAAVNGAFFSTGQRCTASSRLIVQARVHDAFVERIEARMAGMTVGPALDPASTIGPVVSARQLERVLEHVEEAQREGARVLGGGRVSCATRGHFMAPALLLEARAEMRSSREEIFGPVASVFRVETDEEALALANATNFGLSAGVFTTSLARARRFKRELAAGMVMVNLPTAGVDPHAPFGGRKASSLGPREQGAYAREFYTQVKTAYVG